jgi:diacylglycerol kinase (ATP)
MRAAAIFGLDSSEKDLQPFRQNSETDWLIGLPASRSQAEAILIFGGDGTIHRHLAPLLQLQLPLLVVPCGSGNDFARSLGIFHRRESLSAWRTFCSGAGNVRCIDLGVIKPISDVHASTSHYFCCVGGVGLDTQVARRANRLPRWLRAHGGYLLSLPSALLHFTAVPIRLSLPTSPDQTHLVPRAESRIILAAFANGPAYGGGMKIAPRAQLDDGKLDVCIVHDIGKAKLLSLFPTVYFGRHLGITGVEYLQADRLRIDTDKPSDVYADGEYVCQTPVEVTVARNALRVIHP